MNIRQVCGLVVLTASALIIARAVERLFSHFLHWGCP
jgi:hypothetical protein